MRVCLIRAVWISASAALVVLNTVVTVLVMQSDEEGTQAPWVLWRVVQHDLADICLAKQNVGARCSRAHLLDFQLGLALNLPPLRLVQLKVDLLR